MQGYIVMPPARIIYTVEIVNKLTCCADLMLRILAMDNLNTIPVAALIFMLIGIVHGNLMAPGYKSEGQLFGTLLEATVAIGYAAGAEYTNRE
jgi:hypothetical protein